jgi:hypothetical protein
MTKFIAGLSPAYIALIFIGSFIVYFYIYSSTSIFVIFYFLWLYSLASESIYLIGEGSSGSINKLIGAMAYAFLYILYCDYKGLSASGIQALFHIAAMFCMFYSIYFVAKSIKSAEMRQPAKFEDFAMLFFCLWFFPLGFWVVQNKMKLVLTQGNLLTE